jgi:hypothetical protein
LRGKRRTKDPKQATLDNSSDRKAKDLSSKVNGNNGANLGFEKTLGIGRYDDRLALSLAERFGQNYYYYDGV